MKDLVGILELGVVVCALAEQHNVTKNTIYDIVTNRHWNPENMSNAYWMAQPNKGE